MKLFTPLTVLILCLAAGQTCGQNFTAIDTLPEGAYGTAAWGDFDGDGFQDLAYLTQAVPLTICRIYHNKGNVFTEIKQHLPALYNPAARWADLNNDGFDDLVVNGMDSVLKSRTFIYKSLGNGTFTSMPNSVFPLSAGSIDIADYNKDGLMDIAVTGMDSTGNKHAHIYKNTGAFKFSRINTPLQGIHFGELKWGDYNHDNLPDLVINGIGSPDFKMSVYKNMGADSFQLQPFYMKGSAGTVDWTDADNDGWLDLLATGYDSTFGNNITELHHNNQDGTFSLVNTNLPEFGEPSGVEIADFNMDGNMDICFIGGSSSFFENSALAIKTGPNTYNARSFFRGDIDNPVIASIDMDNDGDIDMIFANLILRNDTLKGTGIRNLAFDEKELAIYPNPANDRLTIQSSATIQSISVYDVSGNEIFCFTNFPTNEIMLDNFHAAIYFMKIKYIDGDEHFRKIAVFH